jgi:ferredoxin
MGMPSKSKLVSKLMNKLVTVKINEELCDKCGICTMICPTGHIIVDEETNYPKTVNSVACIQCLRCMSFCHSEAIKVGNIKNLTYRAVPIKEMLKELK